MNNVGTSMAKLAGIRKATAAALTEKASFLANSRLRPNFPPGDVGHYFKQTAVLVDCLRQDLPALYADFQPISVTPLLPMPANSKNLMYSRRQLERLVRDIDQVFEIRANSELSQPSSAPLAKQARRVFISHGRSSDWREVQAYIERDIKLATLELAQEANAGQTIIEKLENHASECDSAVIVMTGDDTNADGQTRARENVMHEIGFFQAKYGRAHVCLLHEEEISIPTNLSGVVYVPFTKGNISASFGVLVREMKAMYKV